MIPYSPETFCVVIQTHPVIQLWCDFHFFISISFINDWSRIVFVSYNYFPIITFFYFHLFAIFIPVIFFLFLRVFVYWNFQLHFLSVSFTGYWLKTYWCLSFLLQLPVWLFHGKQQVCCGRQPGFDDEEPKGRKTTRVRDADVTWTLHHRAAVMEDDGDDDQRTNQNKMRGPLSMTLASLENGWAGHPSPARGPALPSFDHTPYDFCRYHTGSPNTCRTDAYSCASYLLKT